MVPGELVAEGRYKMGPNVYREDEKFYSTVVGIFKFSRGVVGVVPLSGPYIPKVGDLVIGSVVNITSSGYVVDIRAPYLAFLHVTEVSTKPVNLQEADLRKFFDVGDMLVAKVLPFDTGNPSLTCRDKGLGKITKGRVISTSAVKVPRLIGKRHSMLSLLRCETGCEVVIAQNGYIWIVGKTSEDEDLVEEAVNKIVEEAHIRGLTSRVSKMLKRKKEELKRN